jgi:hypothetical protein
LKKIATFGMIMQLETFTHELLSENYEGDEGFGGVYNKLKDRLVTFMEGNEYHLQDGILYKMEKLCIPWDKKVQLMIEAHTYRVEGNFCMTKTIVNLQLCVYYW